MTMKFKKCSILLNEDTYQTKNLKETKQSYKSTILFLYYHVARNSCGILFFADRLYFVFCRNKFLRLGTIGVPCWESIVVIFRSTQYPALIIFLFLLRSVTQTYIFKECHSVRQYFIVYRFWIKETSRNWTDTISVLYFCVVNLS